MKLLYFEFKKNFFKPYVIWLILACTFVNTIGIYLSTSYAKQTYSHEAFQMIYNTKLKGELTEEKVNYVISETERLTKLTEERTTSHEYDPDTLTGTIYGDNFFFSMDVYPNVKYAYSYYFTNNQIVEKAKNNIDYYSEKNNPFELRRNETIYSLYKDRIIENFYDLTGMRYYIYYDFSSLIVLLLCVLIITPVFVAEKETRMDQLLPSYKKGGIKLIWIKILFTFIVVLLLSLWFSLCDLIGFIIFMPLHDFSAPVFALEDFQFTPLNIQFSQYLFLSFVCKLIGFCSIISLVLLASRVFKKTNFAFLCSALVVLFPYLSQFYAKGGFDFSELINPALLIKNRYLFMNYSVQNILNFPVSSSIVSVVLNLLVIFITVALIVISSKNTRSTKHIKAGVQ